MQLKKPQRSTYKSLAWQRQAASIKCTITADAVKASPPCSPSLYFLIPLLLVKIQVAILKSAKMSKLPPMNLGSQWLDRGMTVTFVNECRLYHTQPIPPAPLAPEWRDGASTVKRVSWSISSPGTYRFLICSWWQTNGQIKLQNSVTTIPAGTLYKYKTLSCGNILGSWEGTAVWPSGNTGRWSYSRVCAVVHDLRGRFQNT